MIKVQVTPVNSVGVSLPRCRAIREFPENELAHGSISAAYAIGDVINQSMENVRVDGWAETKQFKDPRKFSYHVKFKW